MLSAPLLLALTLCASTAPVDTAANTEGLELTEQAPRETADRVVLGNAGTLLAPMAAAGLHATLVTLAATAWAGLITMAMMNTWRTDPTLHTPLFFLLAPLGVAYLTVVMSGYAAAYFAPLVVGPALVVEALAWLGLQSVVHAGQRGPWPAAMLISQAAMTVPILLWTAVAAVLLAPWFLTMGILGGAMLMPSLLPRGLGMELLLAPVALVMVAGMLLIPVSMVVLPSTAVAAALLRLVGMVALSRGLPRIEADPARG